MSTVNKVNGKNVMITKGALDVLLSRVVKIETSKGIIDFTEKHRKEMRQ